MSHFTETKPHIVLTPYPAQGHINPLFKLVKLLHLRGFHITFVHTQYTYKRFLQSSGSNALYGLPDFRFETIPDGLFSMDDDDADCSQEITYLCDSIRKNFLQPFRDLLARLNQSATDGHNPPVTCLVYDCFLTFPIQAAQELGVPILLFCPTSAATFLTVMHFPALVDKGIIPLKGINGVSFFIECSICIQLYIC
ncbi:hypothetical protein RJT34_24003 [Clitoria ternatea]|uniref:Uncharacterized protein n=1 Tax=Clitoria ternatea TaxID=43366 RepID=A0AAN9IH29_CLITE